MAESEPYRTITAPNGLVIALEEPCPGCSGTGVFSRGMLTGRCKTCGGSKRLLTDNGRAVLALVARYGAKPAATG